MSENKYGNLLDKYMGKENNKQQSDGNGRYGNLLDNTDKFPTIYDKILDVENARRESNRREAERQAHREIEKAVEKEREQQKLQERIDKNTAFVDSYLAQKEAEQKAIVDKKKAEEKQADFYKTVEKMANIDPHMAEVYLNTLYKK